MKTRYVVGCMSGTSLDGLDLSYIKVTGEGLNIDIELIDSSSISIESHKEFFKSCVDNESVSISAIIEAASEYGKLHEKGIKELVKERPVDLISVHGQTLYHKPPLSCQLLNPFPIAAKLNCPVVYDLRGLDLACGGEGAPLTPMSDFMMYRQNSNTVVLNLGGFCNFTYLPENSDISKIEGGDICVCNQLLDAMYQIEFEKSFDEDGFQASQGMVHENLFAEYALLLNEQAKSKRSLGSNDEMKNVMSIQPNVSIQDRLRTLCGAIANVVCQNIPQETVQIILAGGGALNQTLFKSFSEQFKGSVISSDEFGIPVQDRESIGFAVLGVLCQDRVAITLPKITGKSSHLVSGAWVLP